MWRLEDMDNDDDDTQLAAGQKPQGMLDGDFGWCSTGHDGWCDRWQKVKEQRHITLR